MSPTTRLIVNALLRLLLFGFGLWFAFFPDSLPNAPVVSRAALTMLFTAVAILLGEIGQLRDHMGILLKVLRAGNTTGKRDDRDAIDLLIQGLSSPDASTREKAHHHLKRLTKQDMAPKVELWQAWWAANRDAYAPEPKDPA